MFEQIFLQESFGKRKVFSRTQTALARYLHKTGKLSTQTLKQSVEGTVFQLCWKTIARLIGLDFLVRSCDWLVFLMEP